MGESPYCCMIYSNKDLIAFISVRGVAQLLTGGGHCLASLEEKRLCCTKSNQNKSRETLSFLYFAKGIARLHTGVWDRASELAKTRGRGRCVNSGTGRHSKATLNPELSLYPMVHCIAQMQPSGNSLGISALSIMHTG